MYGREFERVSGEVSKNIVGTVNHVLDFEDGQPLELLHLNLVLPKVIAHALAPVEYVGEPMELGSITYLTGKFYPAIRECALKRVGEEIFLDSTEDELKEERLLRRYLPSFENVARNMGPRLYILGVAQFIPQNAYDLLAFLCEGEPLPKDYKWRDSTAFPRYFEYYRINPHTGHLERASTFQKLFSDRETVQYHTHFVIGDDETGLRLSGSDIEIYDGKKYSNQSFGPTRDLAHARVRGETGIIYIRLDADDIALVKNGDVCGNTIQAIAEKNLDNTLLGISMTFHPSENGGGKYVLYPITFKN